MYHHVFKLLALVLLEKQQPFQKSRTTPAIRLWQPLPLSVVLGICFNTLQQLYLYKLLLFFIHNFLVP